MEYRLSKIIGPGFFESHRAVQKGAGELIEAGGRGSGKSSFLSVELVLQLVKHPDCHALVVRKVASTLRTSVYGQILWAIVALGLRPFFRCSLSPMECEYLPTGQRILFFGMDDPDKLKSIKMPFGYLGLLWLEELDQFGQEEVRSVEQSVFRGGQFALSLKSFNPPPDPGHWVNLLPGQHRSTYLQLPQAWLGQRFLEDAERLRLENPTLYRHEYLGEPVGLGERVFTNLRLEEIDPGRFRACVSGVDWGWWPDPWAFNRVCCRDGSLYIFDELTRYRCPNRETAALIAQRIPKDEWVMADSAEEKSIADYRSFGLRCRGARKGPGSVAYSMKWLQSLRAIVIDPVRCPDTAREFARYAYGKGGFPDKDNHHIDAVRYAVSQVMRMES